MTANLIAHTDLFRHRARRQPGDDHRPPALIRRRRLAAGLTTRGRPGGRITAAGGRITAIAGRLAAAGARATPRLRNVRSARAAHGAPRFTAREAMNRSKRKIHLSRESIRVLTAGQLDGLVGAGTTSVFCPSGDACPMPSQGPCSMPCAQSEGVICY